METRENIVYTDLEYEDISAWKFLLQNLTFEKINRQFEAYQDTCLRYPTSFKRIENNINSLFNVEYSGHDFYPNFRHTIISEKGDRFPEYFFRIRKVEKGVNYDVNNENTFLPESIEFEDIQSWNDVWEKPANLVTNYQRLSKPLNSVLYTSLMPSTALLETDIKQGDLFFLIAYKSKRKIQYSDCCNFIYYNNLSENENMKRYIIFQFLRNEFTRVLPESYDSEIQYCAAEAISRKFFISDDVEGIQYPSTRGIGHRNFAFWGNSARNCLDFIGFRCCVMNNKIRNQSMNSIFADGFWNNNLKKFEFYSHNSDKSKEIFGDILLNVLMSK